MFYPSSADNIHMLAARSIFGTLDVPAAAVAGLRTLILVCFTNRSGSWLLADLLRTSGRVFVAGECLNGNEMAVMAQRHRLRSFAAFVEHAIAGPAVDGRVVLKCGMLHLELLGRSGLLDLLRERIRFVHIERLDRLGQAISWEIAVQTNRWSSAAPRGVGAEPEYRRNEIAAAMARFDADNRQFAAFFAQNGIEPVQVTYEALLEDPAGVAGRVVEGLGLGPAVFDIDRVGFRRQADARNAAWRARFLAESAG